MATYKKRFLSENEMELILEESGSEGGDCVFSESRNSSESESESESEDDAEESAVENSESSDSDDTAPPAPKRTKDEGWRWVVTRDKLSKFHFTGNPGMKPAIIQNLPPEPNPLEVFQLMVHDSLWEEIAVETNRFAVQFYDRNPKAPTKSQWFPATSHEIKAYFALCVLMAQVRKPNLQSYWSIRKSLHIPFFSEVIPFKRFVLLSKFLHFTNNKNLPGNDRVRKIAPVLNHLKRNFREAYYPQENVVIDDSLIKFRGRLCYIQSNPQKGARFGVKICKICESVSGYCLGFSVYAGKDADQAETQGVVPSEAIVFELMEPYLRNGHTVFTGNSHTSPSLFLKLREQKTNAVGTVRVNRRNMPQQFKSPKMGKGETKVVYCRKMMALQWMDRKPVTILSTIHHHQWMTYTGKIHRKNNMPVMKPKVVIDYNSSMNAVARQDQQLSSFPVMRKYAKGYKKIFFYMIDVAIFNSYELQKKITGKKQHFTEFRIQLAEMMIESVVLPDYARRGRPQQGPSPVRLQACLWAHFVQFIPPNPIKKTPCRDCVMCKAVKKKSATRYECSKCLVALHVPDCFRLYHTTTNL
jgi:hypothetical protein